VGGGRARQEAAALLGDPVWEAAAAYEMAHSRSSTNKPRALMTMPKTADKFEPLSGQSRMASEVYGMLANCQPHWRALSRATTREPTTTAPRRHG